MFCYGHMGWLDPLFYPLDAKRVKTASHGICSFLPLIGQLGTSSFEKTQLAIVYAKVIQ